MVHNCVLNECNQVILITLLHFRRSFLSCQQNDWSHHFYDHQIEYFIRNGYQYLRFSAGNSVNLLIFDFGKSAYSHYIQIWIWKCYKQKKNNQPSSLADDFNCGAYKWILNCSIPLMFISWGENLWPKTKHFAHNNRFFMQYSSPLYSGTVIWIL